MTGRRPSSSEAKERLRPILMTAATAVLALVPMAIGRTGLTGLYYFPLARTVIGGLTASTFLTLVILPYIYVLFDNLAVWSGKVWREALRQDDGPAVVSTPRRPSRPKVRHAATGAGSIGY